MSFRTWNFCGCVCLDCDGKKRIFSANNSPNKKQQQQKKAHDVYYRDVLCVFDDLLNIKDIYFIAFPKWTLENPSNKSQNKRNIVCKDTHTQTHTLTGIRNKTKKKSKS